MNYLYFQALWKGGRLMTTYEELTLIVNITLLIVAILTYVYKK